MRKWHYLPPFLGFELIFETQNKSALESPEFRNAVKALDVNETPQSWYLPFAHDSLPRPALTAPICELVRGNTYAAMSASTNVCSNK